MMCAHRSSSKFAAIRLNLLVNTFVELAAKELDAHDGEDEPEDEADEEHVDDRRDRVH